MENRANLLLYLEQ